MTKENERETFFGDQDLPSSGQTVGGPWTVLHKALSPPYPEEVDNARQTPEEIDPDNLNGYELVGEVSEVLDQEIDAYLGPHTTTCFMMRDESVNPVYHISLSNEGVSNLVRETAFGPESGVLTAENEDGTVTLIGQERDLEYEPVTVNEGVEQVNLFAYRLE